MLLVAHDDAFVHGAFTMLLESLQAEARSRSRDHIEVCFFDEKETERCCTVQRK